jgi:hypothetical protein
VPFVATIFARLGLAGSVAVALVLALGLQTLRLHLADGKLASIAAAQKIAKADVKAHEATAEAISAKASGQLAAERVRVETVTRTLVQKVPVYVDAKADAACSVGAGFVSVFDAASRGEATLPRPAGGSGGSPSGVPLSAVLATTVEDFGIAYDWRAEALGWRSWYVTQKAAWEKP